MRLRKLLPVTFLILGGLTLSSCSTSHSIPQVQSPDCKVTATNTDLAGCNLSNADLNGVDLQGDNLIHANLNGANLDNANLQGANLRQASVIGVKTNEYTICVNAEAGPCTDPGLNSPSNADASQGQ